MGKRLSVLLTVLLLALSLSAQSDDRTARSRIVDYFQKYTCDTDIRKVSVRQTEIDHKSGSITITLSDNFARQQFRPSIVNSIREDVRKVLPQSLRKYEIVIRSNNKQIDDLVPNRHREFADQNLLWNGIACNDEPWVSNSSAPFSPRRGLNGVHLSVTPSHGYYFDNVEKQLWKWQRPSLWCTREDLLTQSFVYPYLIPMLENAGAIVYSTRERDWQTECVVADDQDKRKVYQESSSRGNRWQKTKTSGYSVRQGRIVSDSSAFVRVVRAGNGRDVPFASATWTPEIPKEGRYAVYVTYQSFPESVTDARYTVHHKGGTTTFLVNQKIGGQTWVYLGTFSFGAGRRTDGAVTLDNISSSRGVVCADAVRFGGGMGNEPRGGSVSGKPRYMEGSRYYTKFAGAPDSVFLKYNGNHDYNEDIQSRPRMTNWLSEGSVYNPGGNGGNVPIELSFALHTDAGVRLGDSIVGSLGICTTQKKDGILATGLTRDVSRDLADQVLTDVRRDIEAATGRKWTVRGVLDDNYCETREPQMPSALLELLSHQNFYDMKYAFDPEFRFTASRAMYKAILKYVSFMHGRQYTVQPLPVNHMMITMDRKAGSVRLSWQPVQDPVEPSARPDGYIVYTSTDGLAFDEGVAVKYPYYEISPERGHVYSFKVTAVNSGGQSMPSETLSACISNKDSGCILIVNGFQRLSGPATVESGTSLGFDLTEDEGVQYVASPILCGFQQVFDRTHTFMTDEEELGFSGDEFDGKVLAGNTFDYPYIHGSAIAAGKRYSFVSCSREAVEDSLISLSDYDVTDLILGLQKHTSNDTIMGRDYSTFTPELMQIVSDYCASGGKLLTSGSYIGSDLCATSSGTVFAHDVLHFTWSGTEDTASGISVKGLGSSYSLATESDEIYRLRHPDIIEPVDDAIAIFAYSPDRHCAGVAHSGGNGGSTVTLGFPLESIEGARLRTKVMESLIEYLLD